MQCGELEAALRHQQEAYASLEGQLTSSRQKVKELQVRLPFLHQCLSHCHLAHASLLPQHGQANRSCYN